MNLSNINILHVEDDLITRFAVKTDLTSHGALMFGAKNTKETFEVIDNQKIDVILMDIRLAGNENGLELTKEIFSKHGSYPVIFLTGSNDSDTINEALALEPKAILNKPIDYKQLRTFICIAFQQRSKIIKHDELESDKILSMVYETANIGMCLTDNTGKFIRVNEAYKKTYGFTEEELIGQNFTKVLPENQKAIAQKMHDDFISGDIIEMPAEWNVKDSDGRIKDVYVTAGRLDTIEGNYKVTTVTDITERNEYVKKLKNSLEERKILVKEIYHRVKNNLNLLSSMFHLQTLQLDQDHDAVKYLDSGINRIKSLSLLHEYLYKNDDLVKINTQNYITDLADVIIDNTAFEKVIDLDRAEVDMDTAIPIGLITNELVTNAIKHGNSDKKNRIKISFKVNGKQCLLAVSDNGRSVPKNFDIKQTNTLGMQLITALTEQLSGNFSFEQKMDEKIFQVSFELNPIN